MCYFLYLSVPEKKRSSVESLREGGFTVVGAESQGLLAIFPRDHSVFEVTHGGCSCDFLSGKVSVSEEGKERLKYSRKGWSEQKIERALQAKRKSGRLGESKLQIAFRRCIRELVSQSEVVGLFTHFFSGDTRKVEFSVPLQCNQSLAEYDSNAGFIEPDSLVLLHAGQDNQALQRTR